MPEEPLISSLVVVFVLINIKVSLKPVKYADAVEAHVHVNLASVGSRDFFEEYITVAEAPGIHQLQVRQVIHSAAIKGIIIRP